MGLSAAGIEHRTAGSPGEALLRCRMPFASEPLGPGVVRIRLLDGEKPASFDRWIAGLREADALSDQLRAALASVPFAAFAWELPALTTQTLHHDFECVCVDSPRLAGVEAEPETFAEHFQGAEPGAGAVAFENLRGDSGLVAPLPGEVGYPHLAAFVRTAPREQGSALWATVGASLDRWLGPDPLWLSTAGLGVYWLHLRLDPRPKYYRHVPYRDPHYLSASR